jgi:uncharacterized protein with FMN-binding domain
MESKKVIIGFTVVAIIGVGAAATGLARNNNAKNTSSDNTPTQQVPSSPASYKDGTYTSEGKYNTPAGVEQIIVSLTVKDGRIEDSTVTAAGTDRESIQYEQRFISGYKTLVVGKSLDEVKVGKVSGSSLTGQGFNAAVEKIKSEARD